MNEETVNSPDNPDNQRLYEDQSVHTRLLGPNGETEIRPMNRRRICYLIIMAYGYFCTFASISLQAPFFPGECDIKGVSPLNYGLIFGVFEYVQTLTGLIYKKMFAYVTPHSSLKFVLFLIGTTNVLFGFLDKVTIAREFAVFALFLRIGEGVGTAVLVGSCHELIKFEFSSHLRIAPTVCTLAATLGFLLGSPIGGALLMAGGFIMPFAFFGCLTLFGGLISMVILPTPDDYTFSTSQPLFIHYEKFAEVLSIAISYALIGYNDVTLAHHLSQFDLSPIEIGSIFIANRLPEFLFYHLWDKLEHNGVTKIWILGTVINIIGLLLIGPVSFLPTEPKLWLIILSLIIIGIGLSAKKYSTLTHNGGIKWFTALPSLAVLVGPVTGGYLIGTIGYRAGTLVFLALEIITLIIAIIDKIYGS